MTVNCSIFCSPWNINFVGLGGIYKPYTPDDIYTVVSVIFHPDYDSSYSKAYNDIALLGIDGK